MKLLKNISLLILITIVQLSCKKDYLEKTPDEDLTLTEVFASRSYAEQFLNNVYASLPTEATFIDQGGRNPFIGASDEMEMTWTQYFCQNINNGAWSASTGGTIDEMWIAPWQGIRKANIFLENVSAVPTTATEINAWKGEAHFLRAFNYFLLFRVYGALPIISHSVSTDDDFTGYLRKPVGECVDFIAADCDTAVSLLTMKQGTNNYGRASAAAALALKARLLLYAASPLFNGNTDYASVVDTLGTVLFPQTYDANKWQLAADAAKNCIDQCLASGYSLYTHSSNDPMKNYQYLFLDTWNNEVIYALNLGNYAHSERCSTPISLGGWSGYDPTQEQVDEYEMNNGLPITDPNSGYVETGFATQDDPNGYYASGSRNMYVNREPRFYASVNYNGQYWRDHTIAFYLSGADGRGNGGVDYCITGYTLKKFSDPDIRIATQSTWPLKTWIYFRLGEMYLNYAEALNEAQGAVDDVYKYVNLIRERSGLPDLASGLTQDEMRERIRHERRIELAFETHRYFDCHRWKIAQTTDNAAIHGMNTNVGSSLTDESYWVRTTLETRIFTTKHYLWPIPQSEIDKNKNLVQNYGW
ncbi:MAG: RagB/SusD family nutrient uptake outer membrane protein [Niabella sp.]